MNMKRKIITAVLVTWMTMGLQAQIICLDSEEIGTRAATDPEEIPFIPILGVSYDQYAPLPDAVLLLCFLGGAYLLKKKTPNNSTIKHQISRYEKAQQNQAS